MSRARSFRSTPILAALSLLLLAPLGACQSRSRTDQGAEDVNRTTATPGAAGQQSGQYNQPGQVSAGGSASQQMNRGDDSTRRTGVAPDNTPPGGDRSSAGAGAGMGAGGGVGGTGGASGAGSMDRTGSTHTGTSSTDTTRTTTTGDAAKKTDDKTGGAKKTDDKKGAGTSSTDTTRTTASDPNR